MTRTRSTYSCLLAISMLSGCATYKPVPDGYTGPTAVIVDSGFKEDETTAQIFALVEVNGQAVENSFHASASASQGRGFSLTARYVTREVPATPMKVTLKGAHTAGAAIQQMISQATGIFLSVEGVVDFTPTQNRWYVVKGELKKGGSSIWIEDEATGQPVTRKVTAK
ncbi:MAG: hypothetical protein ACT4P9_09380 [Betaproteobacteria bacterium]